jgi:hypothetical protein
MLELERLQVRVVSGRLGRKEGGGDGSDEDSTARDDDDDDKKGSEDDDDKKSKKQKNAAAGMMNGANNWQGNEMGGAGFPGARGMGMMPGENGGMGGGDGLKMGGADSNVIDDDNFGGGQPNRPYVGGGSAAAYEAARADFYRNSQQNDKSGGDNGGNKTGGMGDQGAGINFPGGGGGGGSNFLNPSGGMPHLGLSVNPNQHYEMLKLHHMNLLNEIQETTLMMNLYQQQQLQQQQQQKKSQQVDTGMDPLAQLGRGGGSGGMDASGFPSMHPQGAGNMMGLGMGGGFGSTGNMASLLQQGQFGMNDAMGGGRGGSARPNIEQSEGPYGHDPQRQIEEQERKLRQMKEELARNKRPMNSGGDKNKRVKGENS